jgi:metal-responsive CopG/Arc/MetJ family transcriptional regulator
MKNKGKQPVRSADNSRMTVSLPKSLLEKIDSRAAQDNRKRSNWVVKALEDLFAENGLRSLPAADAEDDRKVN